MDLQLVVFSLMGRETGVPLDQVREITRFPRLHNVSEMPPGVLGVANLRGEMVPVVSLSQCCGAPQGEISTSTRVLVSEVAGMTAGFVVDAVGEVLRLSSPSLETPAGEGSNTETPFVKGIARVGDRAIVIMDLHKVFSETGEPGGTMEPGSERGLAG